MILPLGGRGPGFKSRRGPFAEGFWSLLKSILPPSIAHSNQVHYQSISLLTTLLPSSRPASYTCHTNAYSAYRYIPTKLNFFPKTTLLSMAAFISVGVKLNFQGMLLWKGSSGKANLHQPIWYNFKECGWHNSCFYHSNNLWLSDFQLLDRKAVFFHIICFLDWS